jgi:hypothetical protein
MITHVRDLLINLIVPIIKGILTKLIYTVKQEIINIVALGL